MHYVAESVFCKRWRVGNSRGGGGGRTGKHLMERSTMEKASKRERRRPQRKKTDKCRKKMMHSNTVDGGV